MIEQFIVIAKWVFITVALIVAIFGNSNALELIKEQYKKYFHRDIAINIYALRAAQVASAILTLALIPSIYRTFYPERPLPASTRCVMQSNFDKAKADGVGALREIIQECQSIGGPLVAQAKVDLEVAEEAIEYNKALTCLRRVSSSSKACNADSFNVCLINYASASQSSAHLEELRTTVQRERDSDRCKALPTLPPSLCADQRSFAKAVNAGADGLRSFIEECQSEGGVFVEQAKVGLKQADTNAYQASSSCIDALSLSLSCSSEAFAKCQGSYAAQFPTGDHLTDLKTKVQQELASTRCQPISEHPLPQTNEPQKPPPEAEICFTFNGQSECEAPAKAGGFSDKTIVFSHAFAKCSPNQVMLKRLRTTEHLSGQLYVGTNGKAYLFYARSTDAGVAATINAGQESSFTTRDFSALVGGRNVTEEHRIPVTVSAHFDGSNLLFAYSLEYRSFWPDGRALTLRRTESLHFKLSSDKLCSVLESKFSIRETTDNLIEEDYTCGPAVVGDSCKIIDGLP